jgi:hypothetical protein
LVPGLSSDEEVVRIFGKGINADSLGDCGERIYTNPSRTITVTIILATDSIVSDIEIEEGFHPPSWISESCYDSMVSFYLVPLDERFAYFAQFKFGSTPDDVEKELGKPNYIYKENGLVRYSYVSSVSSELATGVSFFFHNGKLIRTRYWQEFG